MRTHESASDVPRNEAHRSPPPPGRGVGVRGKTQTHHPTQNNPPPGFHALIGNPPFMGGQKITGNLGKDYRDYLLTWLAEGARGSADLCAYFFLQAAALLRPGGRAGLIATNTIAQGDTREVGLDRLAQRNIAIPRAVSSRKWPGTANLEMAHVWLHKGDWLGGFVLDDQPAKGITPYLAPPGAVAGTPHRLAANQGKSFQGSIVLGMGFVLELNEAQALIDKDPRNKDCLFPYLNGEDLNSRPDQSPSRWVINFHDWPLRREELEETWEEADEKQRKEWLRGGIVPLDYSEPVAADYPELLRIIEEKVKPDRLHNNRRLYRYYWWHYAEKRKALYSNIQKTQMVLALSLVNNHLGLSPSESTQTFSHKLAIFLFENHSEFALLQSSLHYLWAWKNSSTMRVDINYSPSDCFETFPFPESLEGLESIGQSYYQHRQAIMQTNQEGLTKTYNRFHDPDETDPAIHQLRELHTQMEQAVAAAYGWHDLQLDHGFHQTKQGLRFTLSGDARQQVLDRLLQLNFDRYAQEVAQGLHDKKKPKTATRKKAARKKKQPDHPQRDLFGDL